ncbi:MAG: DUF433 domain-containing protein [Chloroflexi bacterium]|nr:DUF433 domain-containing protein [Chloroflexota bacterium]
MTIKWVKVDPLVMNGEPFCYGTRLSVRNILEMRRNGLTPDEMLGDNPELRQVGIAEAFRFAAEDRQRYEDFFGPDGSLEGPGFTNAQIERLPEDLRSHPVIAGSRPGPTSTT